MFSHFRSGRDSRSTPILLPRFSSSDLLLPYLIHFLFSQMVSLKVIDKMINDTFKLDNIFFWSFQKNKKINDMFKLYKKINNALKSQICYMTMFKDLNKTLTLLLGQKKSPTQQTKLPKLFSRML